MNDTLGIIGSGMLGGAVARLAVNAGMDVVLSNSRGPETLRHLTADLGPRARAATPAEAAAAGDWTVVAVPFRGVPNLPADADGRRDVAREARHGGSRSRAELDGDHCLGRR